MKPSTKAALAALGVGVSVGAVYFGVKAAQGSTLSEQFRRLGDINGDGIIDDKDLAILQASYGATKDSTRWNPRADLNGDGIINIADMTILTGNYGLTFEQWRRTKGYAGRSVNVPIKEI